MACTACLVCFISTVNGRSIKKEKKPIKTGASSRHITNLKQFILEAFDIYAVAAQNKAGRPDCLFSRPAFSAHLPCQPVCHVSLHALFCTIYWRLLFKLGFCNGH
jgi:hypothetical protein